MNADGGGDTARAPGPRPVAVAAGAGLLWGAFAYSVLWNGTPFGVDRRFVASPGGTLLLLPARIVLWAVHLAEEIAGRPFELSRSTWILGLAVGLAGSAIALAAALLVLGAAALGRATAARRPGPGPRRGDEG